MDQPAQPQDVPYLTTPTHPFTAFFHVFFKVSAWIVYLFTFYFWENFVMIFIIVVMLLALDFWVVKNITGRFLVGLRWWNEIKEDGTNRWRFESAQVEKQNISWSPYVYLYLTTIFFSFF
jgi:hypothetical protein